MEVHFIFMFIVMGLMLVLGCSDIIYKKIMIIYWQIHGDKNDIYKKYLSHEDYMYFKESHKNTYKYTNKR